MDEDIDLSADAFAFSGDGTFSWEIVLGGVVFFWSPLDMGAVGGGGGGGGGVGVRRWTKTGGGDGGFNAIGSGASFGSETARVFKVGNWVVITTGFVVLFEGNVGIGAGLTALVEDTLTDEVGVGILGGLKDELNIQDDRVRETVPLVSQEGFGAVMFSSKTRGGLCHRGLLTSLILSIYCSPQQARQSAVEVEVAVVALLPRWTDVESVSVQ